MSPASCPKSIAELTPDWWSDALAARFPGIRVARTRVLQRIDGTAVKLRIQLDYALPTDAAGAPPSVWIKGAFDAQGAHQGEAFANEVNFFRDIAPMLPIQKPESFYGVVDPETRDGVVILEDLLLRGASFGQTSSALSLDQIAAVLTLQAHYHACLWNSPTLESLGWLKAGGAIAETNMVAQYFGLWDSATALPRFERVPAALRDRRRAQDALSVLIRHLRNTAVCLVHGDAHTANLFFDGTGAPGYLDWQHAMHGNWGFDVANFLITSLTVPERRAHERALLEHYLDELARHGAPLLDAPAAWRNYSRYAMWNFMWVMCPVSAHPEEICQRNTERACSAIEDLETLRFLEAGLTTGAPRATAPCGHPFGGCSRVVCTLN